MKFAVAAAALFAAGASAYSNGTIIVTEVVSSYVTYCPEPTEITHGDVTYTVTEATTLTITDCPCTITKPVTTTSEVICHTCTETHLPPVPTPPAPSPPSYNTTVVTVPTVPGTGAPPAPTTSAPGGDVPAAAGKTVLSAGLLAGVVGLAAFL